MTIPVATGIARQFMLKKLWNMSRHIKSLTEFQWPFLTEDCMWLLYCVISYPNIVLLIIRILLVHFGDMLSITDTFQPYSVKDDSRHPIKQRFIHRWHLSGSIFHIFLTWINSYPEWLTSQAAQKQGLSY